jgi:hypothetical protein
MSLEDNPRYPGLARPKPGEPVYSFMPGESLVLVRHSPEFEPQRVAAELQRLLIANGFEDVKVVTERAQPFAGEQQAFTLLYAQFDPRTPVVEQVRRLQRQLREIQPFTEVLFTPNWLLTGAQQNGGVGGPGAVPVLPNPAVSSMASTPPPWEFTLPSSLPLPCETERGAGVEVVVLDSAPPLKTMHQAAERLRARGTPQLLLESLLASDFQVISGQDLFPGSSPFLIDQTRPLDAHLSGNVFRKIKYDLVMDHGLFVAGIIHSIAPKAAIHLVEVLNAYGIGTLETVAQGLLAAQRIKQQAKNGKVVINCSLVLNVPPPELLAMIADRDPALRGVSSAELARWSRALEIIIGFLEPTAPRGEEPTAAQQTYVVAAAGNDNDPTSKTGTPQARYPASFDTVLGVGALQSDKLVPFAPTIYSNRSDRPERSGIATLGGVARITPGGAPVSDPRSGMLGIYIGPLRVSTMRGLNLYALSQQRLSQFDFGRYLNDSGWARWAGTSFATPVISGVLAALLAVDHPDPVGALRSAMAGSGSVTPIGEVFPVTQG